MTLGVPNTHLGWSNKHLGHFSISVQSARKILEIMSRISGSLDCCTGSLTKTTADLPHGALHFFLIVLFEFQIFFYKIFLVITSELASIE